MKHFGCLKKPKFINAASLILASTLALNTTQFGAEFQFSLVVYSGFASEKTLLLPRFSLSTTVWHRRVSEKQVNVTT